MKKKQPKYKFKINDWTYEGDHKMKRGTRNIIPASICNEPKCKFYGKEAAQGVCYSRIRTPQDNFVKQVMQSGENFLKEMKNLRKANKELSKDAWIKSLEAHIVCSWANSEFTLMELIHLRAENAKLRLQVGRWRKK